MKSRSTVALRSVARVLVTSTVAATAIAATVLPARATVLEQKWVAGQRLAYDLKLSDATLTLQSDSAAPFFWAGVPWEVALDGTGEVSLDTTAVDEAGAGTVAMRLPRLQMNGSAMGMFKAALDVQNGLAKLSINGQPANGRGTVAKALVEPTTALQISRYGQVQRIVSLRTTPAATGDATKAPKSTVPGVLAQEMSTLIPTALLQALPQLWPGRDIKVGEKWTVQPKLPVLGKAGAAKDTADKDGKITPQMISLGDVNMTLLQEETVDGLSTQRVAIAGTLALDAAKSAALMGNTAQKAGDRRLTSLKQTINGDIWFDDKAGQIVKMVVKLNTQSAGVGTAKAKDTTSKPRPWKSYQNFDGTLAMQLRKVS
jgi:hypothetical protein